MNKIINGKRYNTETAEMVASYHNNQTGFHMVSEKLYRKRSGEFFIYGVGGAMSKYAERVDSNSWCGGSKITPITLDEAKQFVEANEDADTYEALFGAVSEDDTDRITVEIPAPLGKKLRDMAARTGRSMTEIITEMLNKAL